jgi:hypothetical protein
MLASQLAPAGRLLRRRGFTGPGNDEAEDVRHAHWPGFFFGSIFTDQAALNGTRPDSPLGVEPA